MSNPKRQHWVPVFYLKYFSIPETQETRVPQVWAFHKDKGDPFPVNVNDIALKKYLYSPTDKEGIRSLESEMKLASLETTASLMWPIIANEYFDIVESSIRKLLALFISTLYLRHPRQIVEMKRIHQNIVKAAESAPKDINGLPLVDKIDINGKLYDFDTSNYKAYKNASNSEIQQMFVDGINGEAVCIAEILLKKRWSIVISETPVFITSDNPVALLHRKKETFGFGTYGTIVHFPISPYRVLVIDDLDEPDGQYYQLQQSNKALYNFMTWTNAYSYMISHRHTDEVLYEFSDNYLI